MPRQPRIKDEFSLYHVILRGNEKKRIFERDKDKLEFLDILRKSKEKYNFLVYAYCIMNNHVHLMINSNGNDISLLMKSINISYAYYYNKRYNRCGHLFQDRFKSERVDNEAYFVYLSKYIHRNPVKAGLVKEAGDYLWSSYLSYIAAETGADCLVQTDKVLEQFGISKAKAVTAYIKYISEEDNVEELDLEDDEFEETIDNRKVITEREQAEEELKKLLTAKGIGMDQIKKTSKIRNSLIKEIRKNTTLTMKEIGNLFGGISESRVSKILNT